MILSANFLYRVPTGLNQNNTLLVLPIFRPYGTFKTHSNQLTFTQELFSPYQPKIQKDVEELDKRYTGKPATLKFLIIKSAIAIASLIFVEAHLNRKLTEQPVIDHIHKPIVLKLPDSGIKTTRPCNWQQWVFNSNLPVENRKVTLLCVYINGFSSNRKFPFN